MGEAGTHPTSTDHVSGPIQTASNGETVGKNQVNSLYISLREESESDFCLYLPYVQLRVQLLLLLLIGWPDEARSEQTLERENTIGPPEARAPDDLGIVESWYATPDINTY